MAINQKLFDAILTNAIDVLRLSAAQRAAVMRRLKRMEKELIAKLAEEDLTRYEKARIETVLEATDEIIEKNYKLVQGQLDLEGTAEVVSEFTHNALVIALGDEAINLPRADYFKSLESDVLIQGAPSEAWWKQQAEKTRFNFTREVKQGLANSETNQQIISRIVGKKGVPGVMDVARKDAAALVQTSVQAVANDARLATFDANPDVIKGLRQVSTLDSHTSLICVSYSGKEWNLKREPINGNDLPFNGGPPRHFNCRSVLIPITKTFRDLGVDIDEAPISTRASSDGQISADTSFDSFLKRKGKAYQDEVLGEGRADLWRKGKITLRDLVNGEGRPISLAELREKAKGK